MIHAMLDLETLGPAPDGAIIAIGGATFNPLGTGVLSKFRALVDVRDALKYGTMDPNTFKWWLTQDDTVMRRMMSGSQTLREALLCFNGWYKVAGARRIWANGTTFDMPILEHALKQVGLVMPYHYRDVRDMRWFRDVVPPEELPAKKGDAHDAVDDAVWQAEAVQASYAHLRAG